MFDEFGDHLWMILGDMLDGFAYSFGGLLEGFLDYFQRDILDRIFQDIIVFSIQYSKETILRQRTFQSDRRVVFLHDSQATKPVASVFVFAVVQLLVATSALPIDSLDAALSPGSPDVTSNASTQNLSLWYLHLPKTGQCDLPGVDPNSICFLLSCSVLVALVVLLVVLGVV